MTTMLPKTAMMIVIFTIIITTTTINTSLSDNHQNDWKKSPRYGCCSQVSSAQVLIEVISINIVIEFENFNLTIQILQAIPQIWNLQIQIKANMKHKELSNHERKCQYFSKIKTVQNTLYIFIFYCIFK